MRQLTKGQVLIHTFDEKRKQLLIIVSFRNVNPIIFNKTIFIESISHIFLQKASGEFQIRNCKIFVSTPKAPKICKISKNADLFFISQLENGDSKATDFHSFSA